MKALFICASAHKNGNTEQMLNAALKTAVKKGFETEYINLYEKNIEYCKGCCVCKKTGECFIKDDITKIRKSIISSDLVVVSCPTYFANVTAPLKNLFDRLVATAMDDSGLIPKPLIGKDHKYILLTSCNTIFPFDRICKQSTGTIRNMKEFFNIAGMKYCGKVILSNSRKNNTIPDKIAKKIQNRISKIKVK